MTHGVPSDRLITEWRRRFLLAVFLFAMLAIPSSAAVSPADLRKTVEHLRQLSHEQVTMLEQSQKDLADAQSRLNDASSQLASSQSEIDRKTKEVDELRQSFFDAQTRADTEARRADGLVKKLAEVTHEKNKLKNIGGGLAAMALSLLAFQLLGFLPIHYRLIASAVASLVGFGSVWILL